MKIEYILLMILIIIAFYIDITRGKIPNILTYSTILVGLIYHLIADGINGLLFSIIGMIVGFSIFIILYMFGAIGAGDVKLFAAIGSLTGSELVLYISMYSIIYAGVIGLFVLIVRKEFFVRIGKLLNCFFNLALFSDVVTIKSINYNEMLTFPFMYAVLPGVVTTMFFYL